MKLKIIDDSMANKDLSLLIWQESRPLDKTTSVKDITKIDAPVNDFPTIILGVESTIIEREVIASMIDVVMWAQTSRVENILDFKMFNETDYSKKQKIAMNLSNKLLGASQDEYRMLMPVMATTKYSIKISLRSVAKLSNYFYDINLVDASTEFLNILIKYDMIDLFKNVTSMNLLPEINNMESGRIGDTIVISKSVPFSLRTHAIRHSLLSVKDNLKELIMSGDINTMCLADSVNIQISASVDVWETVYSKRSCWLAHHDLWMDITKELDFDHEKLLPCNNGHCPYEPDARQRYDRLDPGVPCPKHIQFHVKENTSDLLKDEMIQYAKKLPIFWTKTIEGLK